MIITTKQLKGMIKEALRDFFDRLDAEKDGDQDAWRDYASTNDQYAPKKELEKDNVVKAWNRMNAAIQANIKQYFGNHFPRPIHDQVIIDSLYEFCSGQTQPGGVSPRPDLTHDFQTFEEQFDEWMGEQWPYVEEYRDGFRSLYKGLRKYGCID